MSHERYRCWIEVSRERIASNYRAVRDTVGSSVEVMPVVKADAYRHGAAEVSRVLVSEGVRWLAVSSVEEGVALRASGIDCRILVMADFLPYEREELLRLRLTPAIHSLEGLRELDELAGRLGLTVPYHLKIDTGMGRLGTRAAPERVAEAVLAARHAQLEGLMTHFASAAVYTTGQTSEQIRAFQQLTDCLAAHGVSPKYRHMSATIPIAYGRKEAWGTMVRPGHAVYGYVSPVRGNGPPMQLAVSPSLEWKAAILEIKEVPEGTKVGYGAMFEAPKPMRLGVLAVGYGDGLPHRLGNRGRVLAAGRFAPILGAVSMDLTTVDLTGAPELHVGDSVTLLGRQGGLSIDAQQIARLAGTISYSVLCGISSRVKRIYL